MQIIYARQPLPEPSDGNHIVPASMFLVGPTPRSKDVPSWRPQALEILEDIGFPGVVFVPEDESWGLSDVIYEEQTDWEIDGLGRSAAHAIWIPRNLRTMPGFTTNSEFTLCYALALHRMAIGAPPGAEKVRYQRQLTNRVERVFRSFGHPVPTVRPHWHTDLRSTLQAAVSIALSDA